MCNPVPAPVAPETVAALVESVRRDRLREGEALVVGFFGGEPPSDALLEACGGLPLMVRVRPDLLSRADARRLTAAGVTRIELDALSLDRGALREAGRAYPGALVLEQAAGIRALGLEAGVVLAPGLPATDHAIAVNDAARSAGAFDTARLHPVVVLDQALLREAHMDGTYAPLTLAEAVTTCRAMLDVLEAGGTEVIRIGVQQGDGLGRLVAGPRHPAIRQLVEARAALPRLRNAVRAVPRGARVVLRVARADETVTRGPFNQHIRTLRAEGGLASVRVVGDPGLPRGTLRVEVDGE
ncbi:MAG: hypothetical protein ACI8PZ_007252 [Myxococcota bacterium]|jgi:hypothetical protein